MVGLPGRGGLPGHQALHPRFEQHHRPTAEQFHTATVEVRRHSSEAVWDPQEGRSVYPAPAVVWTGQARIARTPQMERPVDVGGRRVVLVGAVVSIPADSAEVQIGDEVRVTDWPGPDTGDPHLAGRPLWVNEVRPGSLMFQRDLVVADAAPTSR